MKMMALGGGKMGETHKFRPILLEMVELLELERRHELESKKTHKKKRPMNGPKFN